MANTRLNTRFSSPTDFATATSTSFRDALHSTPQPSRSPLLQRSNAANNDTYHSQDVSDAGSSSAEVSIEVGRGGKRINKDEHGELSSNIAISFAMDNSRYEVADTPPGRGYTNPRLLPGKAPQYGSQQRNISMPKQRATSEAVRDSASKQAKRPVMANTTVQSTTYTANHSFVLPDIANLTELVSGPRGEDSLSSRPVSKPRSRFTSANHDPYAQPHRPIDTVGLPHDEKAILASLQSLKDRVSQQDMERDDALQEAKHWKAEAMRSTLR